MNNTAQAERRKRTRELNALIDACLLTPQAHPPRELAVHLPAQDTVALAERVRRRATLLSRRDRRDAEAVLAARDALIQALYAHTAPRGAFAAWCDGSSKKSAGALVAGIGGLLMEPQGRIVTRLSRVRRGLDSFAAEIAALEVVLRATAARGAERLCVFTDCVALQRLWLEKRTDPRLERVRELTRRFRRFDLRALPRPHNQPADRLARLALARATAAQKAGDSYTEQ